MRPYGVNPKHKPSSGPRQSKAHRDDDPAAAAERERVLAIVADMGKKAKAGRLDHLTTREVWRVVRVKA